VAFAFLIVMAVATLPSPLYGLYRTRDDLSAFTITIIYAIFAGGTIVALLAGRFFAARVGRRGVMLGAVATMIAAAGLLAVWKDLPGLLIGRLLTGVAIGLAAGTAIVYLIELRVRADPKASVVRARTIGTSVNVGALGSARWLPAALPNGRLATDLAVPRLRSTRGRRADRRGDSTRNWRAGSARAIR
jgi:MFS family permease